MDQDITKAVRELGIALVESQHQFFMDESIDNSEHVPAIKRIADTAYRYLKAEGINPDTARKVRKELIAHGKDLFIAEWITEFRMNSG